MPRRSLQFRPKLRMHDEMWQLRAETSPTPTSVVIDNPERQQGLLADGQSRVNPETRWHVLRAHLGNRGFDAFQTERLVIQGTEVDLLHLHQFRFHACSNHLKAKIVA